MLHDRGDITVHDWDINDFIIDGNWHTLDCSQIVSENAIGIYFHVETEASIPNRFFRIRKKGNTNSINCLHFRTEVANRVAYGRGLVICDENKEVEYIAQPGIDKILNLTILLWID